MKYGVFMFPAHYAMRPDDLACALEQRGFESLFFPEHSHMPVARRTPYPLAGDATREYWSSFAPFVALAVAAVATKTLRIGTGICLLVQRDPIHTAKEVASLDVLSNGRMIFGIGGGWNAEEMENHGTNFKTRWKLLRERVAAVKEIWTHDEASYHGELVKFDGIQCEPKPVQKPHPPILLASLLSPKAIQRVVSYCDGWMPNVETGIDLPAQIKELRRAAEQAGRDPESISITAFVAPRERRLLDQYAEAGVERAVFHVPAAGTETVLPLLDEYAKLIGT